MPNFGSLNAGAFDNIAWEKSTDSTVRVDRSIYRLVPDKKAIVRFLSDPADMQFHDDLCAWSTADGSWVKYREARAFDGYKGDRDASHKFIPVVDYQMGAGGRTNRKDALQEQIRPSESDVKNRRSFASAKDVMLVNVIFEGGSLSKNADYDPNVGSGVVLALSPKQFEALGMEMKTAQKYKPDFTFTEGTWELLWRNTGVGGPSGWELEVTQMDAPPLDSTPDPVDSMQILRQIRAIAEGEVFGTSSDDVTLDDIEAELVEDEAEADAPAEEAAPASAKRRSPAFVKGALRKQGVSVPARISTEELYSLAAEHGIAS